MDQTSYRAVAVGRSHSLHSVAGRGDSMSRTSDFGRSDVVGGGAAWICALLTACQSRSG